MADPDDFFEADDDADEYPRHRVRRALVKAVALTVIIGLLLAFPLGYLLDAELQNQRTEAVLAVVEVTIVVVLVIVIRASRRRI